MGRGPNQRDYDVDGVTGIDLPAVLTAVVAPLVVAAVTVYFIGRFVTRRK